MRFDGPDVSESSSVKTILVFAEVEKFSIDEENLIRKSDNLDIYRIYLMSLWLYLDRSESLEKYLNRSERLILLYILIKMILHNVEGSLFRNEYRV